MNAAELKAKARERLAEIAREREALATEERELRAMIGEAVSLVPTPPVFPFYDGANPPMVRPIPYDVRPLGPSDWPPGLEVTCAEEDHALNHGVITARTTGCAVVPTIPGRIGAEHSTPDEGIVYGAAS